jgi:hypothetical protein
MTDRRRYNLSVDGKFDAGDMRHPQEIILAIAPDATGLEAHAFADCWLFEAERIANLPAFVTDITGVADAAKRAHSAS